MSKASRHVTSSHVTSSQVKSRHDTTVFPLSSSVVDSWHGSLARNLYDGQYIIHAEDDTSVLESFMNVSKAIRFDFRASMSAGDVCTYVE